MDTGRQRGGTYIRRTAGPTGRSANRRWRDITIKTRSGRVAEHRTIGRVGSRIGRCNRPGDQLAGTDRCAIGHLCHAYIGDLTAVGNTASDILAAVRVGQGQLVTSQGAVRSLLLRRSTKQHNP